MKVKKLKLKKQVWGVFVVILFLIIAVYAGNKIHQDKVYKSTTEYKLLQLGYTNDEINLLKEKIDNETYESLKDAEKNNTLISLVQEKYYLKKNLNRYLSYLDKNNNLSKVISIVNTNNDYDFYDHDIDTDITKDYLLLVNKFYHLNEDYEPEDLVDISNTYYYGSNHKTRKIVYDAFIDMWNEAKKENIYLIINSSYRNFNSQKEVYDYYKDTSGTTEADKIAARPGYSEHQTGLSLDIFSKENTTTSNFKNSTAYLWLENNAYKYGFIERYKEGQEDITGFEAEAWHWRYVGIEAATYIYNNNITFDEYYAYFIEK